MKSVTRFAIVGALLVAGFASAAAAPAVGKGKSNAPGLADNFYRGITTVGSSSTTETVVETTVLSSETETRTIGGGQFNNGKDGNLQDRSVETVQVVEKEITTVTVEAHRGAPVSKGKDLSYTTVTETVVSDTTTTVVGDWGAAYDVPSDVK
jgi:hypothetical protein